jgi:hypothetical protein
MYREAHPSRGQILRALRALRMTCGRVSPGPKAPGASRFRKVHAQEGSGSLSPFGSPSIWFTHGTDVGVGSQRSQRKPFRLSGLSGQVSR